MSEFDDKIKDLEERIKALEKRVSVTQWLTLEEAGEYLKVSKRTIMRWIYEGKLKYHKTGRSQGSSVRLRAEDLDNMMIPFLRGEEIKEEGDPGES